MKSVLKNVLKYVVVSFLYFILHYICLSMINSDNDLLVFVGTGSLATAVVLVVFCVVSDVKKFISMHAEKK